MIRVSHFVLCLLTQETTHLELKQSSMLSAIASLTPFSDFNQSPRNMYQCQVNRLLYLSEDDRHAMPLSHRLLKSRERQPQILGFILTPRKSKVPCASTIASPENVPYFAWEPLCLKR